MDQEKFKKEMQDLIAGKVEGMAMKGLAAMLKEDVNFFWTHYMGDRVIQKINKGIDKLNFSNEKLLDARKAFLDVLLDGFKPYSFDDEVKELKKVLKKGKGKEKEKARERLQAIERIQAKVPNTTTEERDMICEPVCDAILDAILDREYLVDHNLIKGLCEIQSEMLVAKPMLDMCEAVFDVIVTSIDESYALANQKKWGCPREKIKMSQLDKTLKDAKDNDSDA